MQNLKQLFMYFGTHTSLHAACSTFTQNANFVALYWEKKSVYKTTQINLVNWTGIAYEEDISFCKRNKGAEKQDISLYPCFQQQCPICVNWHGVFGTCNSQVTMAMQLPICEKMYVSLLVLSSLHLRLQGGIQVSAHNNLAKTKKKTIAFKTQIMDTNSTKKPHGQWD